MHCEKTLALGKKRGRPRLGPRCCVCELRFNSVVRPKMFCMATEPPKTIPNDIARGDGQDRAPAWCPIVKGDL